VLAPILILIAGAIALLLLRRGSADGCWTSTDSVADGWSFAPAPEPIEPCWTDEIGREGGLSFGRGQCFNATLMSVDRRTARGEYPAPVGD
jgi:hypothetical protein